MNDARTKSAGDDVHVMKQAVTFANTSSLIAVQADGVHLVDVRYCTVAVCRVTQISQRTYRTYDNTDQLLCKEKINNAYSMLGLIKRNFIYLTEEAFVTLYKSLVRCHLEYANSVWNPYRQGLIINDLENVQVRATKLVLTVKHLKYKKRLIRLQLPTLRYERMRGDMIEVYTRF